jgi:predicted dehydrogenase
MVNIAKSYAAMHNAKALVIGYGSIGSRHARLLAAECASLSVVTAREDTPYKRYPTLEQALSDTPPDYIVVCTATSQHAAALHSLKARKFSGRVLVEKPLFASSRESQAPYPFMVHVAYQLRFHPVIQEARKRLAHEAVHSAHVYVGQHLAQWRPHREVKETYSAHAAQGGGVMRDLSHELDLVQYLFGDIQAHQALAVKVSDITHDSEDAAGFLLTTKRCPLISLQMNYLDHTPRREWIINTAGQTMKLDLITKTLEHNSEVLHFPYEADDAYRAMHRAVLHENAAGVCRFDEALAINALIDTVPITPT